MTAHISPPVLVSPRATPAARVMDAAHLMQAYARSCREVGRELERLLSPVGLELVSAIPEEDGACWRLRVRARRGVSGSTAEFTDAEEASVHGAVDEFAETPARDLTSDPTFRACAARKEPGDTLATLLARGDGTLILRSGGEGGIALAAISPEERGSLVAATLVGDVFLDLRHRNADEAGEEAVRAVLDTFRLHRERGAEPEAFLVALAEWAPPDFPASESFLVSGS